MTTSCPASSGMPCVASKGMTGASQAGDETELSPRERRDRMRERNAALVRELAHRKRLSHLEVNTELNRRAGIRRVTEATLAQLEKRAAAAEQWLRRR